LEKFGTIFEYSGSFYPKYGIGAEQFKGVLADFQQKYNDLVDTGVELKKARERIISLREDAMKELDDARILYRIHVASIIDAATSNVSTKTDADGRFSFNLERGKEYIILATASRSVGESKEYYKWSLPVNVRNDQDEMNLMLSNDTMVDSFKPDSSALYLNLKIPEDLPEVPYIKIISERKTFKSS
jgi:hypothetical protein